MRSWPGFASRRVGPGCPQFQVLRRSSACLLPLRCSHSPSPSIWLANQTPHPSCPAPLPAPRSFVRQIVDIIITRHHDTGKPKGCFVEFGSQDHLAKALTADGEPMMRRPIRIQVAEPPRRDRDGFGERRCVGGEGGKGGLWGRA